MDSFLSLRLSFSNEPTLDFLSYLDIYKRLQKGLSKFTNFLIIFHERELDGKLFIFLHSIIHA